VDEMASDAKVLVTTHEGIAIFLTAAGKTCSIHPENK